MKSTAYLIIGKNGIRDVRKNKPSLEWDEITVRLSIDVPDILFQRPLLEASIVVDKNILPDVILPDLVINTKELIERQAGVKIDFKIVELKTEGETYE
jgi:hypothetical protein